jgi:hypothetical protein
MSIRWILPVGPLGISVTKNDLVRHLKMPKASHREFPKILFGCMGAASRT